MRRGIESTEPTSTDQEKQPKRNRSAVENVVERSHNVPRTLGKTVAIAEALSYEDTERLVVAHGTRFDLDEQSGNYPGIYSYLLIDPDQDSGESRQLPEDVEEISTYSPIGRAVQGKNENDSVEYQLPNGATAQAKILKIYPNQT